MKIDGKYMAPTFGDWFLLEDAPPEPGVVVLGIGWCCHGFPVLKLVILQLVNVYSEPTDDLRMVWTQAFGEGGVLPPPIAWTHVRFDTPLADADEDDDDDEEEEPFDPEVN